MTWSKGRCKPNIGSILVLDKNPNAKAAKSAHRKQHMIGCRSFFKPDGNLNPKEDVKF